MADIALDRPVLNRSLNLQEYEYGAERLINFDLVWTELARHYNHSGGGGPFDGGDTFAGLSAGQIYNVYRSKRLVGKDFVDHIWFISRPNRSVVDKNQFMVIELNIENGILKYVTTPLKNLLCKVVTV